MKTEFVPYTLDLKKKNISISLLLARDFHIHKESGFHVAGMASSIFR